MGEIKMDVQRMVKRRKDSGFTLIELMIVIAVIGILAVVLVPKVGGVKTAAKSSGLETNIRTVQAYAESRIDTWSKNSSDQTTVASDINSALGYDLKSPYNNSSAGFSTSDPEGTSFSPASGTVCVKVAGSGSTYTVTLYAYDNNSAQYDTVDVKP
ncbi:type II secretion system protein [Desulfitobacterium sp. AusDCA]|uniref:type II secretion system protein n=1 Tax=Desulfitobacterium sp. AusDCA TaxID=3240383 RepID=UPI003DA76B83